MFRFESAYILWFIVILPMLAAWVYFSFRIQMNSLHKNADEHLISRLLRNWSVRKYWLKNLLILLAAAFLFIAWSNPQWGYRTETVKVKSSDIVIALDISESMLAEDISPNRMERAKFFLSELVKKLKGDRIGLIFFAGSAYLQMPLTNDYASAETFIQSANPSQAGTQGTVIAEAIELSKEIFGEEGEAQKALIILSDGENHDAEAIEAARTANDNGVSIFTLGIGTEQGAMIPLTSRGRKVFKTDASGQAVTTALNVSMLQDIANAGGGKFYMVDSAMSALDELDKTIEKLEKKEIEQRSFSEYNSYFQLFLAIAICLLMIEYVLGNKKSQKNSLKKVLDI